VDGGGGGSGGGGGGGGGSDGVENGAHAAREGRRRRRRRRWWKSRGVYAATGTGGPRRVPDESRGHGFGASTESGTRELVGGGIMPSVVSSCAPLPVEGLIELHVEYVFGAHLAGAPVTPGCHRIDYFESDAPPLRQNLPKLWKYTADLSYGFSEKDLKIMNVFCNAKVKVPIYVVICVLERIIKKLQKIRNMSLNVLKSATTHDF
ncbi:hypothetical protein K0M31_003304, partial [Melipona bicolor]